MWNENEKKITKLTMEVGDTVTSWEVPYTDCDMDDLLNAFFSLCIGHTWLPSTILESMKNFAENNMSVLNPGKDEDGGKASYDFWNKA